MKLKREKKQFVEVRHIKPPTSVREKLQKTADALQKMRSGAKRVAQEYQKQTAGMQKYGTQAVTAVAPLIISPYGTLEKKAGIKQPKMASPGEIAQSSRDVMSRTMNDASDAARGPSSMMDNLLGIRKQPQTVRQEQVVKQQRASNTSTKKAGYRIETNTGKIMESQGRNLTWDKANAAVRKLSREYGTQFDFLIVKESDSAEA